MTDKNYKERFRWDDEKGAQLMTMDETAKMLRIAKQTLYNFVYKKQIPVVKVGSRNMFEKSAINKWLFERIS